MINNSLNLYHIIMKQRCSFTPGLQATYLTVFIQMTYFSNGNESSPRTSDTPPWILFRAEHTRHVLAGGRALLLLTCNAAITLKLPDLEQ